MTSYRIYPFGPEEHISLLLELWAAIFGPRWPVVPAWFYKVALNSSWLPGDHLIAEQDDRAVGFVLTQVGKGSAPDGSILAIGVLPEYRQRGVGRALQAAALDRLRQRNAAQVRLGSGGSDYFWPGVPLSLPEAWPFFSSTGWLEQERSFDLVRSLEDYHTPGWVWDRLRGLDLDFVTAEGIDPERVVNFVAVEETGWKDNYADYLAKGRAGDVLLACRRSDREIVGACLLDSEALRWAARFPRPLAAPGCFLTAEKWQGRGIGMALVARANEMLQQRNCKTCFIGWTWLVDWYGKLGFTVCEEHLMSGKKIVEREMPGLDSTEV